MLKWFLSDAMVTVLEFFKQHLSNLNQIELKLEGRHQGDMGGSELLKSFSSNIHDGGDGGKLETLQTTSDSELLKTV